MAWRNISEYHLKITVNNKKNNNNGGSSSSNNKTTTTTTTKTILPALQISTPGLGNEEDPVWVETGHHGSPVSSLYRTPLISAGVLHWILMSGQSLENQDRSAVREKTWFYWEKCVQSHKWRITRVLKLHSYLMPRTLHNQVHQTFYCISNYLRLNIQFF